MPSVAKGFSLDLALAGSKVGIVEPTFGAGTLHGHKSHLSSSGNHHRPPAPPPGAPPSHHHHHHHHHKAASLVYNYKKYEQAGVLDPAVLIKAGSLSRQPHGTVHTQQVEDPLPRLRYHQQGARQGAGGGSGGSVRAGSGGQYAESPTIRETHYTNRQRVLLEQDHNQRTSATLNKSDSFHNKDLSQEQLQRLASFQQEENNGLTVGSHDSYNNLKTVRSRPFSSQFDSGKTAVDKQSGTTLVVQRHSSDNLLSNSDQLVPGGTSPRRTQSLTQNVATCSPPANGKPHPPETLHWTPLSPPCADPQTNSINSDDPDLQGRPSSPSPTHTNHNLTPSPRYNPEDGEEEPNPGVDYGREYIETMAKENQAIKKEVQKSLKRLLKRAVWSAGGVTKAEVQSLRAQLNTTNTSEARHSPRGRRGSGHSQDSGISSDSITREPTEDNADQHLTPREDPNLASGTNPTTMEQEDLTAYKNRKKKQLASKLKSRRKSRSSGKKSRQKARPDSVKRAKEEANMGVTREGLNLQAYCQTMQVLPSSLKPKAEKPQISVPTLPMRATTTAIYKERLPRVPQPTLTCDGNALKEKQVELAVTYPPNRRSLNLNPTKISSYDGSPRKSHVYAGGAVAEEAIRLTKVYLSEKQSGMLNELGLEIPYAPPVTPMPEVLKRIEYIPSMFDIRAQRAVKAKLEILDRQDKKRKEKQAAQQVKSDKAALREQERDRKKQQRLQIYALNKVMTAWENKNFVEFCSVNGIDADL